MENAQTQSQSNRRRISQDVILNIVINGVLPLVGYMLLSPYMSEVAALTVVAFIPLLDNIITFARHRRFDVFGLFMLSSLVLSIGIVLLGGDKKFILVKESLLTGFIGLGFLASLLLPRPIMFYFSLHFAAGNNETARQQFVARWQYPYFRYVIRLMTVVWGLALLVEAALRIALVFVIDKTEVFLAISPFVQYGILGATIAWTVWYSRHAQRKAEQMRLARERQGQPAITAAS